jgi:hypothetical protein
MEAYAAGKCSCQICEDPLKRDAHNTTTVETESKQSSDIDRTAYNSPAVFCEIHAE